MSSKVVFPGRLLNTDEGASLYDDLAKQFGSNRLDEAQAKLDLAFESLIEPPVTGARCAAQP